MIVLEEYRTAAVLQSIERSFLHPDITAYDSATLTSVAALLVGASAAGAALAARRAVRVDPNVALRDQ